MPVGEVVIKTQWVHGCEKEIYIEKQKNPHTQLLSMLPASIATNLPVGPC